MRYRFRAGIRLAEVQGVVPCEPSRAPRPQGSPSGSVCGKGAGTCVESTALGDEQLCVFWPVGFRLAGLGSTIERLLTLP